MQEMLALILTIDEFNCDCNENNAWLRDDSKYWAHSLVIVLFYEYSGVHGRVIAPLGNRFIWSREFRKSGLIKQYICLQKDDTLFHDNWYSFYDS